jgi:hypothetical protein
MSETGGPPSSSLTPGLEHDRDLDSDSEPGPPAKKLMTLDGYLQVYNL